MRKLIVGLLIVGWLITGLDLWITRGDRDSWKATVRDRAILAGRDVHLGPHSFVEMASFSGSLFVEPPIHVGFSTFKRQCATYPFTYEGVDLHENVFIYDGPCRSQSAQK